MQQGTERAPHARKTDQEQAQEHHPLHQSWRKDPKDIRLTFYLLLELAEGTKTLQD